MVVPFYTEVLQHPFCMLWCPLLHTCKRGLHVKGDHQSMQKVLTFFLHALVVPFYMHWFHALVVPFYMYSCTYTVTVTDVYMLWWSHFTCTDCMLWWSPFTCTHVLTVTDVCMLWWSPFTCTDVLTLNLQTFFRHAVVVPFYVYWCTYRHSFGMLCLSPFTCTDVLTDILLACFGRTLFRGGKAKRAAPRTVSLVWTESILAAILPYGFWNRQCNANQIISNTLEQTCKIL